MLVYTIKELCRTCYTCVRECPAKAIRIVGGQAEVITERCIACGNCTKVCSQGAKVFLNTTDRVLKLLADEPKVAAMLAPSFPAEFYDVPDYRSLIGMIRSIGFEYVAEVSFGADLVADRYKKLVTESSEYFISSDCPSIVNYIKFYHPALADRLAPVVSPMVAMSKVIHEKYGKEIDKTKCGVGNTLLYEKRIERRKQLQNGHIEKSPAAVRLAVNAEHGDGVLGKTDGPPIPWRV